MKRTSLRYYAYKSGGALLALALLALAAGVPARAQEVVVHSAAVQPAEPPLLEVQDNKVPLSLDRAIEIALQQNLGLLSQRYLRSQRRLGITQSLGYYDLLAGANAHAEDSLGAAVNELEGTASNLQSLGFSFRQNLPTGGDLSVGASNLRSESNAALRSSLFYSSGLTFTYNQPLLRSFGRLVTEQEIMVARTTSQVSSQEFEGQVTLTVQQVVNAYWDLVGAREQLGVARQSLSLAQELHDRNRIQVEVGTMAPLEMVQSEATVATREEDIIRATANVGDAEDQLRRLLNVPPGPVWETPIEPTTSAEIESRITIDVDDAIRTAMAERPELRTLQLQLEQTRIDAMVARSLLKPQLDLRVAYGYNGAAPDAFREAIDQIVGLDFREWAVDLIFSYPIQNRTARAQSAIANLEVDRTRTEFEDQQSVVSTEVRRAARAVETAAKQIDAAGISRQFQERNLDAERKRYENGLSTSFQITQIQEDLTLALSREVTARITYRTALAEYYRVTGRLLEEEGVGIDDPEDPPYEPLRFRLRRDPLFGENSGTWE